MLSHRNPSMEYGRLLEIQSDLALDKYDPRRCKGRRQKKAKDSQSFVASAQKSRQVSILKESKNGKRFQFLTLLQRSQDKPVDIFRRRSKGLSIFEGHTILSYLRFSR